MTRYGQSYTRVGGHGSGFGFSKTRCANRGNVSYASSEFEGFVTCEAAASARHWVVTRHISAKFPLTNGDGVLSSPLFEPPSLPARGVQGLAEPCRAGPGGARRKERYY